MTAAPTTLDVTKLTRVQKLAALLVILGPETAAEVLKGFNQREVADITTAMMSLPVIEQSTQRAILAEFSEVAVAATTALRGGVEFAQATLERALGPAQARQIMGRVAPSQAANSPIHRIIEREPLQIFNALKTEQPQTIALVLSFLQQSGALTGRGRATTRSGARLVPAFTGNGTARRGQLLLRLRQRLCHHERAQLSRLAVSCSKRFVFLTDHLHLSS